MEWKTQRGVNVSRFSCPPRSSRAKFSKLLRPLTSLRRSDVNIRIWSRFLWWGRLIYPKVSKRSEILLRYGGKMIIFEIRWVATIFFFFSFQQLIIILDYLPYITVSFHLSTKLILHSFIRGMENSKFENSKFW